MANYVMIDWHNLDWPERIGILLGVFTVIAIICALIQNGMNP